MSRLVLPREDYNRFQSDLFQQHVDDTLQTAQRQKDAETFDAYVKATMAPPAPPEPANSAQTQPGAQWGEPLPATQTEAPATQSEAQTSDSSTSFDAANSEAAPTSDAPSATDPAADAAKFDAYVAQTMARPTSHQVSTTRVTHPGVGNRSIGDTLGEVATDVANKTAGPLVGMARAGTAEEKIADASRPEYNALVAAIQQYGPDDERTIAAQDAYNRKVGDARQQIGDFTEAPAAAEIGLSLIDPLVGGNPARLAEDATRLPGALAKGARDLPGFARDVVGAPAPTLLAAREKNAAAPIVRSAIGGAVASGSEAASEGQDPGTVLGATAEGAVSGAARGLLNRGTRALGTRSAVAQVRTAAQGASNLDKTIEAFNAAPQSPPTRSTISDIAKRAESALSDKMAAVNRLGDPELEAMVGTYPGRFDAAVQRVRDDLGPVYDKLGKSDQDLQAFNAYVGLQRYLETATVKGNATRKGGGGNIKSIADAQAQLSDLEQRVGPDTWQKLQDADGLRQQALDKLLDDSVKSGLATQEFADRMRVEQPHYNPTAYLQTLEERNAGPVAGSKLSQEWNIYKRLSEAGHDAEQLPPLQSAERAIMQVDSVIRKNDILNKLADVSGFPTESAQKMTLRSGPLVKVNGQATAGDLGTIATKQTKDLQGFVSFFKDGQQTLLKVPPDVERALKNMDAPQLGPGLRFIDALNQPLKKGATQYNPQFLATNAVADMAQAFVREGVLPTDVVRGYLEAARKGDTYQRYIKAGGGQGAEGSFHASGNGAWQRLLGSEDPVAQQRALAKLEADIRGNGGLVVNTPADALKIVKRIINIVPDAGAVVEMGPRLATFSKHLAAGESDVEAALAGRRSTVDFSRSGTFIREMNAVVPFLNAAVQGNLNVARSLRDSKAARMRMGLIMGAAAGAYAYNRQFPEYADVPDYIKQSSIVLMLPGSTKDPSGLGYKDIHYVALPLRGFGALTGPVEAFLSHLDGHDKSLGDAALGALATLNPVSSVSSLLGPAGTQEIVEQGLNSDFYRRTDIVPQSEKNLLPEDQYGDKTSLVARKLGEALKVSPRRIDHAVQGLTGGGGRTLVNAASTMMGQTSDTMAVVGGLLSGIVRSNGGQIQENEYRSKDSGLGSLQDQYRPVYRFMEQNGATIGTPPTKLEKLNLFPTEQLRYQELRVKALSDALDADRKANPEYWARFDSLPLADRDAALSRGMSYANNAAKEQLAAELIQKYGEKAILDRVSAGAQQAPKPYLAASQPYTPQLAGTR